MDGPEGKHKVKVDDILYENADKTCNIPDEIPPRDVDTVTL